MRASRLSMTKCAAIFLVVVLAGCGAKSSNSETPHGIAMLRSLPVDGALARDSCQPILIMVSQFACPYCETLRKHVLLPMIKSGDYKGLVLIREVSIDAGETLIDVDENPIHGSAFAARYLSEILTPTVLIIAPDGSPLADAIIGISSLDYYGSYLDEAIAKGRESMLEDCGADAAIAA